MAKKNEKKNKRLKSLVLLLLLTVLLLSTSTYAWFTANKSVSIDPIDVHIAASSGLQISTDATNWKTMVTNTDITTGYSGHKNMLTGELTPVSTSGSVTNGYLNFYRGTVEGAAALDGAMALTAVKTADEAALTAQNPTSDFVAFDIFLKVDQNTDVYLDRGSGVVNQSGKSPKYLEYAARYAFVIEGNTASTNSAEVAQALQGGTSSIIVEPNYDAHTSSAVTTASQYYNITLNEATSGENPVDYVGVKAPIITPIILKDTNPGGGATPNSTYFEAVPTANIKKTNVAYSKTDDATYSYYGKGATDSNLVKIFSLSEGVTKVRVYMWIEGQDHDCENNASGAFLTYNLGLTIQDAE